MKVVNVSLPDPHFQAVLDQARTEDIIVQLGDGSEFLLAAIDDFDREVAATRKNEKLMAFLDRRAAKTETFSMDEVKRRLGLN